jgi:hypothetical protein
MLDFPASPTVGQQFTAAGVTWTWDGHKWTANGLNVAYLPLTGGTLTGPLISAVTPGVGITANGNLALDGAVSSGTRSILARTSGANRWGWVLADTTPESGANAGSNFALYPYADNGSALPVALSINRASGQVTIPNLSAPGVIGDNRIINGDCRIDQRWNGASGTGGGYTIDRWYYNATQTAKGTWQRVSSGGLAGFPYALAFSSSSAYTPAAGDIFEFYQFIEADFISDFAWGTSNAQPVTLSFLAQSTLTGIFSGSIRGGGGRSYPFTYSLPTANIWTKIVVTIPGDTGGTWVLSGNASGVLVGFSLGAGSTYTATGNVWGATSNGTHATGSVNVVSTNGAIFYVTGVKLEIGSVATPFNRQTVAKSLADCQRYYQTHPNIQALGYVVAASGNFGVTVPYSTTMRASPTITPNLTTQSNCTGSVAAMSNMYYRLMATATAAGAVNVAGSFTADAEL